MINSLKKWFEKYDNRITKLDCIVLIILTLFCYVSFVQGDIIVTGARSWKLFESNFFNYYDVMHEWTNDWGANYMPTTFLLFSLWVLPLKLLGFAPPEHVTSSILFYNMWYKLLPTLFFVVSMVLLYKIAREIGLSVNKSKVCTLSFTTMTIVFYSQFIFSQYDIFTVFFMLLGIYFYIRNRKYDKWLFCLCFGVALTLKYFSLLIFFVFLLLREKKVWEIVKHAAVMGTLFVVELALFLPSSGFRSSVFGFGAVGYISQTDFTTLNGATISFCKAVCCFIVIWAYFVYPRTKDELIKWALYLSSGICFGLFVFATWHPQWLIFAAPFWILSAYINKHTEKFLWLDVAFGILFYMYVSKQWVGNVDNQIMVHGIWRIFLDNGTMDIFMQDIIGFLDINTLYSVMAVIITFYFVFKHPKHTLEDISKDNGQYHMWIIRLRAFVSVFVFVIPAFITFAYSLKYDFIPTQSRNEVTWVPLYSNSSCDQYVSGFDGILESVQFSLATYQKTNTCDLKVDVIDVTSNKKLATANAVPGDVPDCANYSFNFDKSIDLKKDKQYLFSLYSTNATEGNVFAVGVYKDLTPEDKNYVLLNNISDYATYNQDCGAILKLKMK